MQIIHRYNGAYPFSLQHQTEQTYLEIVKENLNHQQIAIEKSKLKILKEIDHTNLIKLLKIYREENTLHLLYEYFPISLEKYVEHRSQNSKDNEKKQIRHLSETFVTIIDKIVETFVNYQIKTDISIQNIAVSSLQDGCLKFFMDPSTEFHNLKDKNSQENNQKSTQNINNCNIFLWDFYKDEKKKLIMEFEQWLETYFGKIHINSQPNHPNFVINGSKLVFINHGSSRHDFQHKNHNMNQKLPDRQNKGQNRNMLRNSPGKIDKNQQNKRDLVQKNQKKIEQIKNMLNKFQSKTPNYHPLQPIEQKLTPHKPHHQNHQGFDKIETRQQSPNPHEKIRTHENIKAYKFPNQLIHRQNGDSVLMKQGQMSVDKSSNKVKRVSALKEQDKNFNKDSHNKPDSSSTIDVKILPNNSAQLEEHFKQAKLKSEVKKQEKTSKYKMKITTSHEFEIQGTGEPQMKEIEKDILQGIKSGRINLSEFPDKSNAFKIQTTQIQEIYDHQKQEKINQSTEPPTHNSKDTGTTSKTNKMSDDFSHVSSNNTNSLHNLSNSHLQNQQKLIDSQNGGSKSHHQTDNSSQNFCEKIRQAKSKAQQVLKQYAKKKL